MTNEKKRGPDSYKRTKIHTPTAETRQQVTDLTAILGYPSADVAKYLQISVTTLVRRYRSELSQARTVANLGVARNLYAMACQPGNFIAARYWAGTRMGWTEKQQEPIAVSINPGPAWDVLFKPPAKDDDA